MTSLRDSLISGTDPAEMLPPRPPHLQQWQAGKLADAMSTLKGEDAVSPPARPPAPSLHSAARISCPRSRSVTPSHKLCAHAADVPVIHPAERAPAAPQDDEEQRKFLHGELIEPGEFNQVRRRLYIPRSKYRLSSSMMALITLCHGHPVAAALPWPVQSRAFALPARRPSDLLSDQPRCRMPRPKHMLWFRLARWRSQLHMRGSTRRRTTWPTRTRRWRRSCLRCGHRRPTPSARRTCGGRRRSECRRRARRRRRRRRRRPRRLRRRRRKGSSRSWSRSRSQNPRRNLRRILRQSRSRKQSRSRIRILGRGWGRGRCCRGGRR